MLNEGDLSVSETDKSEDPSSDITYQYVTEHLPPEVTILNQHWFLQSVHIVSWLTTNLAGMLPEHIKY